MCKVYGSSTKAWFEGRIAGRLLRGIATNPYEVGTVDANHWEDGYKNGRDETEASR